MSLEENERKEMVRLQLERSYKHLKNADTLVASAMYDVAANRFYYACYHAVMGLLINKQVACRTHGGLISEFNKHFVKTGIIDVELGRFLSRMEQLRKVSDYNCNYDVEQEDVEVMIEPAHRLVNTISDLLNDVVREENR